MHEVKYPEGTVYERPGSASKWIRFRTPEGQILRRSAGTTDAVQAYEALKRAHTMAHSLTFKAAVVDFFKVRSRDLKPSTLTHYKSALRVVDPYFGESTLSEITLPRIKEFIRIRRGEVKDPTITQNIAFISTVLTHASLMMMHGPERNICLDLPARTLRKTKRLRWLTSEEFNRLLAGCLNEQQQLILNTAVGTGMRHGELTGLRKHMLDFDRQQVFLPGWMTKNGKPRFVPMSRDLSDTLKKHCETSPDDLVFYHRNTPKAEVMPYCRFDNFFRGAKTRAKLKDLKFHDLRHTFASWWVQKGGNLNALRDILGHSSLAMVERYAHMNTEATHRAFQDIYPDTLSTQSSK